MQQQHDPEGGQVPHQSGTSNNQTAHVVEAHKVQGEASGTNVVKSETLWNRMNAAVGELHMALRTSRLLLLVARDEATGGCSPDLTLQDYVDILGRQAVLFGIYEEAFRRGPNDVLASELGLDMSVRDKLPLLQKDLEFFERECGLKPRTPESILNMEIPDLNSVDLFLGAAFVSEGSTLGGKKIAESLQASFPALSPENGISYYNGQGPENVLPQWDAVNKAIHARDAQGGDDSNAIRSVQDTFRTFIKGFSDPES